MNKIKNAKIFMKMARYDCMIITIIKAAKTVLTFAVIINSMISLVYIFSALKK